MLSRFCRVCRQSVALDRTRSALFSSTSTSEYKFKPVKKAPGEESDEITRARLLYQSKKRGILENDLILGGFASSYLKGLNRNQMELYDDFINGGHNEWDIYYWLSDAKPVPEDINTEIYKMLREYAWQKAAIWHISPEKLRKRST